MAELMGEAVSQIETEAKGEAASCAEDRFRTAAKQRRTLFNAWLTLNNPFLIELIGEAGWDCITIDQQHGLGGNEALLGCLTAARACGLPAIVRVAENDPGLDRPCARCRRARHHVPADRQRRGRGSLRAGGEISAARQSQLGAVPRAARL